MSYLREVDCICIIAGNEFGRIVRNPLVLVVAVILLILAILNGVGWSAHLSSLDNDDTTVDVFLYNGIGQVIYNMSLYLTILAVFLGVLSIGDERLKNTLPALLSKPLYRRDIIIGKFIGISGFMLALISLVFIFSTVLIMLFFRGPYSLPDYILRLASIILILLFECSLSLAIAMLFGILINEVLVPLLLTVTFLYIEWYSTVVETFGFLRIISPRDLYLTALYGNFTVNLLDSSRLYVDWLAAALPFIVLVLLETIIIVLYGCSAFSKDLAN